MKSKTDVQSGLTQEEVQIRIEKGLVNDGGEVPTKTIGQILYSNIFNLFNLLNIALGVLVITVGSVRNALFLGVVLCNTVIGVVQEIRAKRIIDKLSILSAPTATAIRDGKEEHLPLDQLVLDDLVILRAGNQIPADMVVLQGECEVNESLLTGESDAVTKEVGEEMLSGSFVVSGEIRGQIIHIGAENFSAKITQGAKYIKKPNSQILNSINLIIKTISIVIIPLGLFLFYRQYQAMPNEFNEVVVGTVGALIGMIPEGLVLLTSLVMAVGVMRMAHHKTLVQELYCIETLARVDMLCLDKTGTITEGTMETKEVVAFESKDEFLTALGGFVTLSGEVNPTFDAIRAFVPENKEVKATHTIPFSSDRKFSAVQFQGEESYVLGAFEFVFPKNPPLHVKQKVEAYAGEGYRVLVFAKTEKPLKDKELPEGLNALGLVLLKDKIRSNAKETLHFFKEQGVNLKVISGDNPITVSHIAKEAGLENYEKYVDATTLKDEDIPKACETYCVFGRVSPAQKLLIIQALKKQKYTVAMTGDGVNDTLALKEADCSIAMASGSDAARNVSQLVLLNSDFSSLPKVVAEGRKIINNIQRSASLYLVKTMYSSILAVFFALVTLPYPFEPIQLSLISSFTIGIPSFFLALEPNKEKVKGRFIENVLLKALPGGLTVAFVAIGTSVIGNLLRFNPDQVSTMTVFLAAIAGFWVLNSVCQPYDIKRRILFGTLLVGFIGAISLLPELFSLESFTIPMLVVFAVEVIIIHFILLGLTRLTQRGSNYRKKRKAKREEG